MSDIEQLLFGRIVERSGLARPEDIAECLDIQEKHPGRPLGEILVDRGYLTRNQLQQVLDIQAQTFETTHKDTQLRLKESLFGQLVLLKRFARSGDVHECLRLQQKLREQGQHVFLGELLVMKSRMSASQVAEILRAQNKMLLFCEGCFRRVTISVYSPQETYRCENCGGVLLEPKPTELAEGGEDLPDASDG